jgi:FKBP-type peptidyl-prolyl cis-trans isomerase (trigger factor)
MSEPDPPSRIQKRVDRLVNQARSELQALGIDVTDQPPRQILRMARAAKRRRTVLPKKKLI